jgi:hypothetical protein
VDLWCGQMHGARYIAKVVEVLSIEEQDLCEVLIFKLEVLVSPDGLGTWAYA